MPFEKYKYNLKQNENSDVDIRRLELQPQLEEKLISFMNKQSVRINALAKVLISNVDILANESDMMRLAVIVKCLEKTKRFYDNLGIDDGIFYDTMSDIKIWCENNGNKGLNNYRWLTTHIKCEIFKIGRLQYQMFICNNESLDYTRLPFDRSEKVLYVHIPQGEKLIYNDCVKSIELAKKFFNKYFPLFQYRFFFCESWLLYENNINFMKSDSNILKFASLFDIAYSLDDESQAIERIFKIRKDNSADYTKNTSLQNAAEDFMQSGHKLGIGIGTIKA